MKACRARGAGSIAGLVIIGSLLLSLSACAGGPVAPTATAIALVATATPWPQPTRPPSTETSTPRPTLFASDTPLVSETSVPLPGASPGSRSQLDDLLAQRTAQGFLERLKTGDTTGALHLLLTEEAQQAEAGDWLTSFPGTSPGPVAAALLEFRRATANSYEARVLLHWPATAERGPSSQAMTLTLAYRRGLWLIDRITLGDLEAVVSPPALQRATGRGQPAPQLDGRIVFQASSGGNIYLIDAGSGEQGLAGLRRLTDGLDPAWSPDGTHIAFTRWRDPWGVYLIEPDGSNERRLVDGVQLKEVAWSPDGSTIAVAINYGSSEPTEICFFGFCFTLPPFSLGQIWTANLASGALLSLPLDDHAVHAPAWSLAGNRIVYAGDRGLAWIDLDTMSKGRFDGGSAWDTSPSFAPGGEQIAFMSRVHNHWEIFVMNADGTQRRQITHSDPALDQPPSNVAPAWSPDGKAIAFLSNRDGPWRIYVMDASGTNQRSMFGASLDGLGIRYEWATERVISWSR